MVEAKKMIIGVEEVFSPALPHYYAVLRLRKVINGNFECLVNFGHDEQDFKFLLIHLNDPLWIGYSDGKVRLTVIHDKRIPVSAVINAMLQAQADGILPR